MPPQVTLDEAPFAINTKGCANVNVKLSIHPKALTAVMLYAPAQAFLSVSLLVILVCVTTGGFQEILSGV